MIWLKRYTHREVVLAIADKETMGKTFREGKRVLEVGAFYKGELVAEEEAENRLKEATIINAVGKRAVDLVLKAGMGKSAVEIQGIPHIQVVVSSR